MLLLQSSPQGKKTISRFDFYIDFCIEKRILDYVDKVPKGKSQIGRLARQERILSLAVCDRIGMKHVF